MNQDRMKKLEAVAQQLVSRFIFDELEDAEQNFGIITITWVKISSDLSYMDIYVSSLINGDLLTKTLAKHNTEIQRRFNKSVPIRKLPKIRFRYDDSGATGQHITNAINSLKH